MRKVYFFDITRFDEWLYRKGLYLENLSNEEIENYYSQFLETHGVLIIDEDDPE